MGECTATRLAVMGCAVVMGLRSARWLLRSAAFVARSLAAGQARRSSRRRTE